MEMTPEELVLTFLRNVVISLITGIIFYVIFGMAAYFTLGVIAAITLTVMNFWRFSKENKKILYGLVFLLDVLMWPTAVLANILEGFQEKV